MLPYRFYIGFNLFLCISVTFMYRTCFSLVLREMISQPFSPWIPMCSPEYNSYVSQKQVTRFNWTANEQIYLISAYYISYTIANLLGGFLAERFGAKRTISFILVPMAVTFALIPLISNFGYKSLFFLRLLQGSLEGPIYPAIQQIIAFWAPPSEKGRFISAFAGSSFGSMIGQGIVGVSVHYLTWASSFYFSAILGFLVWLFWLRIVTDRPDQSDRISGAEKIYIESVIKSFVNKEHKTIPHGQILKSGPVWALIILNFGACFISYLQMNAMPTYYNEVLRYPVEVIAEILAISSLIRFGTGLAFSFLGDFLLQRDLMGLTMQRKYFCIYSHFIPGMIIVAMCYLTEYPKFSAALDVLITAIMGSINLTVNQNSQDLAPNFASSIYGYVNFTGAIGGFATLLCLSFLVNINDSVVNAWKEMFLLTAVLLIFSAGYFLIFGTGKIQKWNWPTKVLPEPVKLCHSEMASY